MAHLVTALTAFAPVFAPLTQLGRAELVARRLGDAITFGVLPDGLALPSEPELAERLGVGTTTVREALGVLREDELITTRRGRGGGSFVVAPADGGRAALFARLRGMGQGELRDLGDHYAVIAGGAAELAAERADDDDVRRLRGLVSTTPPTALPAFVQSEGGFHLAVAATTQSARLTREEIQLQNEIGPLLWLANAHGGLHDQAADRHSSIVDAVEQGDGPAARAAAEQHVHEQVRALRPLRREALRSPA